MNVRLAQLTQKVLSLFGLFIFSFLNTAVASTITLSPIATLDVDNQNTWQQIIANPSRNDSYFLISENGSFYNLDKGIFKSEPFFELAKISESATQLTAVTVHPNFSLRDQIGFHVFYTAHVEPINPERRFNRIQDEKITATFDVIVNEWTMTNALTVDVKSKREVLRIGVADPAAHVTKLAFSPFTKVWNDDFGFLYIGLNQDKANNSLPLYSGAIMRINPEKFGLRNYTVPNNNPFINREEIHNELLIIGLQELRSFIWPLKSNDQFIANHQYGDDHLLSLIKPKGDFRALLPSQVLHQSDTTISANNLIAYRGRQLAHLWGATLFLSHVDNQWQMMSLIMPSHNKEIRSPATEWVYQGENYNDNGPLTFFEDGKQELLVLNQASQQLSRAALTEAATNKLTTADSHNAEQTEEQPFETLTLLSVGAIVLFLLWISYLNRKKGVSARYIVRQQYGNFELSESKQQISLFRRHQKTADVILELSDITECHISLNKINLKTISKEHAFSNNSENDLREQFNKERREKMVPDKIRQLNMELSDNQGNQYPICIYLRKGDNRITRKRFGDAIEQTLDWCWTFSESIEPDTTEKREHKPVELKEKVSTHSFDPTKLPKKDNVAVPERPAEVTKATTPEVKAKPASSPTLSAQTSPEMPASSEQVINEEKTKEQTAPLNNSNQQTPSNDKVDTNLINALEKLAHLKEQNALTEQEFEQAKQKVLQGLLK